MLRREEKLERYLNVEGLVFHHCNDEYQIRKVTVCTYYSFQEFDRPKIPYFFRSIFPVISVVHVKKRLMIHSSIIRSDVKYNSLI
jgi:hypothetical protein